MSDETLEIEAEQQNTGSESVAEETLLQAATRPPKTATPAKAGETASLEMLMDVILQLTVELGRTELTVRQVLDLQKGSVVELDRIAGDAVDIFVNDHMIAKGEVVVVDDKFGVRITELVSPMRESVEAVL
jgi:flagellar motor switch protein FliN/FliY